MITCRDGEEAINFIDAHPSADDPRLPLLALLDLRLPDACGVDCVTALRALADDVPIVVLTGAGAK